MPPLDDVNGLIVPIKNLAEFRPQVIKGLPGITNDGLNLGIIPSNEGSSYCSVVTESQSYSVLCFVRWKPSMT